MSAMYEIVLTHLFATKRVSTVLDLGAGDGRLANFAASHGASVVAVDREYAPEGSADSTRVTWVQSSIEDFAIPRQAYDLVILSNVIHFLNRQYVIHQLGPSIVASLRPQGALYLQTFDVDDIVFAEQREGYYTKEELEEIFQPLVFRDVIQDVKADNHPPYGMHQHVLLQYVGIKEN